MLGAHAANVLETERDGARHLAVDRERPRGWDLRRQGKMASDEEQLVSGLERSQRLERRLRVERPSVADDQPQLACARLSHGRHKLSGAGGSHQYSGGGQGERERLSPGDESIVHDTPD
jgi:hypothetical protein